MIPPDSIGTPGESALPSDRRLRRERAALEALRALARDLYEAAYGPVAAGASDFNLTLNIRVRPSQSWSVTFDPPITDQLDEQFGSICARVGVYREGAVHCFKCESSVCDHATPPSPISVFASYDPMGRPEWRELGQVLAERRDPRAAEVYEPHAPPAAVMMLGHELRERQLAEFGRSSRTYAILGQVVTGYFRVREPSDLAGRFALTFQIIEGREGGGRRTLYLNTICGLPADVLAEWLESELGRGVARARIMTLRAVNQMARLIAELPAGSPPATLREILGRTPAVLRRLAESIERAGRQRQRRTRHAEQRRTEDRRPIAMALADVASAPPEAFFHDERSDSYVVCGPQGRVHVFSAQGRHVTSFVSSSSRIEGRIRRGRWSALPREQVEAVRSAIASAPT